VYITVSFCDCRSSLTKYVEVFFFFDVKLTVKVISEL
jgi:hypothetical protein